jgi:hypothetical protein
MFCWNSTNDAVWLYVFGNNSTGSDDCTVPDCDACFKNGPGTYPYIISDVGGGKFLKAIFCERSQDWIAPRLNKTSDVKTRSLL